MGIIVFLIVGLIAGFIARALVPGPDPMGWLGTMILGIVGSFVGGTLAALVFNQSLDLNASGIIGSIIGAIIVLLIWRAMGGRRGVVAGRDARHNANVRGRGAQCVAVSSSSRTMRFVATQNFPKRSFTSHSSPFGEDRTSSPMR